MTNEVTAFPYLPVTDQGRSAFIVNGRGGKLTTTPKSDENENCSVFDLRSSFSKGTGSIRIKLESRGMGGEAFKTIFKQIDATSREEGIREVIHGYIEKAEFDTIIFSDMNDPQQPFRLEMNYHKDSLWKARQQYFTWGSHSTLPLSLLAGLDSKFPEKRNNELVRPVSYKITGSESYASPEKDLLLVSTPKNDSIKNDFFDFRQTFSKSTDVLTVKWSYVSHSGNIPKEKYTSYVNSLKSLKEKINWTISYVDPIEYVSSFNAENQLKVISLSNKTLQSEPDNILSLLLRGIAYEKMKQEETAVKDLQRALELAPDNKYTHYFISQTATARKNPVFVMNQMNRALELDPKFESALVSRAMIYADQKNYEAAMTDINRILTNDPNSFRGLSARGSVLIDMGKIADGYASLYSALNVDSSNVVLCLGLAEGYLRIDSAGKAIQLYNKAINLGSATANTFGNLGWAWYLASNDQKCIEYSEKAASIDRTAYFARYNSALANLRSGNISMAKKIYSELKSERKSINPSQVSGARRDLDDLKSKGRYVNEIKSIIREYF